MSYTYKFHPLTKQDYDEAYQWYEDKKQGLSEQFLKAVRKKIEEIALHPEAYGNKGNKKIREATLNIFPYLIVYKLITTKRKYTLAPSTMLKSIQIKSTENIYYSLLSKWMMLA